MLFFFFFWYYFCCCSSCCCTGLCNTCLRGIPPFQEEGSQPHLSAFTQLFPQYQFNASGHVTGWSIYINENSLFTIKIQVWRRQQRWLNVLTKIGENVLTVSSSKTSYYVSPAERILVNMHDFVGLEVPEGSGIRCKIVPMSHSMSVCSRPILLAELGEYVRVESRAP